MPDTLESLLREAEEAGLEELTLRVSRYDCTTRPFRPVAMQVLTKFHGRSSGPWGIAILAHFAPALRAALEEGLRQDTPAKDEKDIFG